MQFGANMEGMWLDEDALSGFKAQSLGFMHKVQAVSEKLMVCFARGLGFEDDYFIKSHDVSRSNVQTVLRLLHYFAVDPSVPTPDGYYRAGEHADWDFLTLLFQRPGPERSGDLSWKRGVYAVWPRRRVDQGQSL